MAANEAACLLILVLSPYSDCSLSTFNKEYYFKSSIQKKFFSIYDHFLNLSLTNLPQLLAATSHKIKNLKKIFRLLSMKLSY